MRPVHTLFVALLLAGCGPPIGSQSQTSSANATLFTAAAVKVVSGDGQSASAGSALPEPLVVIVLDKTGHTMQNVLVHFTVTAGSASLSAASPWTDSTGEAKTQVTLGSNPGVTTISAQVSGLPPIDFHVLGTGAVAQVTVSSGDRQSAPAGAALAKPLVVEVDDSLGDPISGVAVTFTVTAGGGQLSATNATTDANGLAKTSFTLGPASGVDTVSATAGSLSATFTETGLSGTPSSIELTSGNAQTGAVGATLPIPLCVTVRDGSGNPSPGASVLFAVVSGGGTVSPTTVITNSMGQALASWTLGRMAGPGTVTAASGQLTGSPTTFTATATSGAATKLVLQSGNNQSATAGTTLAPLVVGAQDANGNAVAGVPVSFSVSQGGGSVAALSTATDSTGLVSASFTLGTSAGTNVALATASGVSALTFTETGVAGVASQIAIVSGNAQSATAGSTLSRNVVVLATDANGNPVAGVSVTFTVTQGGGSVSPASATTSMLGQAQTSWTLGGAAGPNALTASSGGLTGSPLAFTATGTAGSAATIAAVSGSGQQATAGTTLAPFVVMVADSNGNPVPGVLVSFTTSGGSLSASSASTGSQGQASTTLTLGASAGTYTVQATRSGLAGSPVVFTATATPSAASSITAVSGNQQTGTVGTTLPSPLVVLVSDSLGNPVPQATVTFTVASGSATASPVTTATDATGRASTTLALGTVSGNVSLSAGAGGGSALFVATALAGPPARLAFEDAPLHAAAGIVLAPAPLVAVTDSYGNAVPQATNQVTMALAANASGGTLSGTGVVPAVTGVATFSSLKIDRPGTGYVLKASSPGLSGGSSVPFDVGLASSPPRWLSGANLSTARSRLAAVTGSDGTTYALGGFATTVLGTAETLASVATAWQALAALPTPRAGLAAAPGGAGRVYAIGGELANGAASTANEVYDPATTAWRSAPSLPTARSGLGAAAANGSIYAVGGQDALGIPVGAVEAYSESANAWQSLAPMLTRRTRLGVAVGSDGRLYAIGGATTSGASAIVEAYDPGLNAWIAVASLATAREGLAAAAGPDGRIYAIGGRDVAGNLLPTVEAYTPATNAWTVVASLVGADADLALATRLSGQLLAASGAIASGPSARVAVYGPTATLSPEAGPPGTRVSVSAGNLAPTANVSVYWGTASGTLLVQGKSDAAGACTLTFTVPLTATTGAQVVTVIDDAASYPTAATFSVP